MAHTTLLEISCTGSLIILNKRLMNLYLSAEETASWFQRRFLKVFIIIGANDPQGVAIFDPRGMVRRVYVAEH